MSRLHDHHAPGEFLERIAAAYDAEGLSERDLQFLTDIECKFDQWGERMFFSDRQADYLASLAERGEADDEDTEQFKVIAVPRYKRSRAKGAA